MMSIIEAAPACCPRLTSPRLYVGDVSEAQQLSLLKLRRCAGLPPLQLQGAYGDGPNLTASWQPDPRLEAALGRLRSNDAELVALDLSGSPPDDGDFLALALAMALAGNTRLASLQLLACGIRVLGIAGLAARLGSIQSLTALE